MKFGKTLANNAFPPWSKHYISYKALKQVINQGERAQHDGTQSIESIRAEFLLYLQDELEKVDKFYLAKKVDLERRVTVLHTKSKQLLATYAAQSDAISSIGQAPTISQPLKAADIENSQALLSSLVETREHLQKLLRFAHLNREGFRKILKKFDKKLHTSLQDEFLLTKVQAYSFAVDKSLADDLKTLGNCFQEITGLLRGWEASRGYPQHPTTTSPMPSGEEPSLALASEIDVEKLAIALRQDDVASMQHFIQVYGEKSAISQGAGVSKAEDNGEKSNVTDSTNKSLGQALYLVFEGACLVQATHCAVHLAQSYPFVFSLQDINERTIIHRLCMVNGFSPSLDTVMKQLVNDRALPPCTAENNPDFITPSVHPPNQPIGSPNSQTAHSPPDGGNTNAEPHFMMLSRTLAFIPTPQVLTKRDIFGRTALHYSAVNGFTETTNLLLSALGTDHSKVDINSVAWCDQEGCTPLFYAVINNHVPTVRVLLDMGQIYNVDTALSVPQGASPLVVPESALPAAPGPELSTTVLSTSQSFLLSESLLNTPLTVACKLGYAELVSLLLSRGANINTTDDDEESPLHLAARGGHTEVLRVLLNHQSREHPDGPVVHLNAVEKYYKWTPLCLAAIEGHLDCVELLLKAGADPNILDNAGWNAHEWAAYRGHCQIIEILRPLSRRPADTLGRTRNRTPSPSSRTTRPEEANVSFIERKYGHTYLRNQALLVITLGSNDTSDQTLPVQLRDDFFELIRANGSPTTAVSLAVSVGSALGEPVVVELPLRESRSVEPLQFLCSLDKGAEVQFDLVPTFGEQGELLGRGSFTVPVGEAPSRILTSAAGGQKVEITVLSTPKLENLGYIRAEYLLIKPFSHPGMTIDPRSTYWKSLTTKVIGHRGLGMNRDTAGGSHLQVGENTVLSFVTAANLGAEYVEFDVQLTKDMAPVIYHDWTVTETGVDVPVHALTEAQFLSLHRQHQVSNRKGHQDPSWRYAGKETQQEVNRALQIVQGLPVPSGRSGKKDSQEEGHRSVKSPPPSLEGQADDISLGLMSRAGHGNLDRSPPDGVNVPRPLKVPNESRTRSWQPRAIRSNSMKEGMDLKSDGRPMDQPTKTTDQTDAHIVTPTTSTLGGLTDGQPLTSEQQEEGSDAVVQAMRQQLDRVLKFKQSPKKVKGNNPETIQDAFTTLEEAFRRVPEHIGFNIEVKYPMKCEAEEAGVWSHLELNRFVDQILQVVYDYAGQRSVIFSSFHPDLCLMLNLKQPNYPVFFLTDGGYWPYVDARCTSLQEAVRFAKHAGLLGIVSISTLILQAPVLVSAIKEQGLLLFTYGVLNNHVACVQLQQRLDVDAVIVDSVMAVRKGLQGSSL
ncbi:Glycerophosphocholine phosphodiesterase [Dispira parvispora]|uniref:Glycerophosphocholine phosphodiesterase n=1 Tax=Dispira parvispora TaxID=1520584 RepID=A0A9W8AUA5_9FUNG|nr:Glycerophosphocholine phosphodiesterase [Dispira parvispora]